VEYRKLGNSGLRVSEVGLGANQFGGKVDERETKELIDQALELGINLIDTADIYQDGRSESFIGQAVEGRRDELVLATKVGIKSGDGPNDSGASRQHIMDSVDKSLQRLRTDYIDLYQIHWWDPDTPVAETMRALDDLVTSGKVRYIGASNYAAWQLAHSNDVALAAGWNQFVSVQPHYHMLERGIEQELVPCCETFEVGILPYFPLAGGFLTGKYRRGEEPPSGSRGETSSYVQKYFTAENFDTIEALEDWARERGHDIVELAIAWLLAQPQLSSVISGVTSPEHVRANARAAAWKLSEAEEEEVRAIIEDDADPA
jgi:aryl-alcohol dehydrogenase-like predicted oxidoreductase